MRACLKHTSQRNEPSLRLYDAYKNDIIWEKLGSGRIRPLPGCRMLKSAMKYGNRNT